jgi:hypothetical protein
VVRSLSHRASEESVSRNKFCRNQYQVNLSGNAEKGGIEKFSRSSKNPYFHWMEWILLLQMGKA